MTWVYLPKSCLFSPELAASTSDCIELCRTLERSAMWRGRHLELPAWLKLWRKENWIRLLSIRMLQSSTEPDGAASWIASQQVFRARTSALRGKGEVLETAQSQDCGSRSKESQSNLILNGCSLKMSKKSFQTGWKQSFGRLPKSGSMRNGVVSRQPLQVHLPAVKDGSCWPTLTVTSSTIANVGQTAKRLARRFGNPIQYTDVRTQAAAVSSGLQSQTIRSLTQESPELDLISYRGSLNPKFAEWLQGFPIGWTGLER